MTYSITAEGLVKQFRETRALDGVSLQVQTGTVFGLLGPNGAGKTTAVRIPRHPDPARPGPRHRRRPRRGARAHQVRRLIGLTGQYASVDETLTGTENLYLIGRLTGLSRQQARLRAAELLTQFSLTEAAGRAARTYSGGMRRRLDLAASLVARPRVLYLDERSSP
jgi:oleandomycin transport system ATP-binding protein